MNFSLSTKTKQQLKKIKQKQPQLFDRIKKQLQLFTANHKHPKLRTHKLKGTLSDTWSISIVGNIRMIYTIKDKKAVFFLIGNHDEVYRK